MVRLNWISNHFTYYNDYLFDSIEKDLPYEIFIYYRFLVIETHPWNHDNLLKSNSRIIKRNLFGIDVELTKRVIFSKDFFVIGGWDCILYVLLITILSLRNIPFAIYTDTPKKNIKSLKQLLKGIWMNFVFRKGSKATLLVTGSIGVKRALENLPISSQKVLNFPFATDVNFFRQLSLSGKEYFNEEIIFLSVGRIDFGHKGQNVTLKALSLMKTRTEKKFKYLIAGTGDDFEIMKSMVKDLDLDDHIIFLGWVQMSDLPAIYNKAHFTIHSSFEDPFPNSILESLSCGTPVIASDSAGSAVDRINQGINGFIHPAGDSEALADILQNVLSLTETEYLKMSGLARQKALDWEVGYHLSVIQSLVSVNLYYSA